MELKMKAICEGRKGQREVIEETIEQYRAVFVRTEQRVDVLRAVSAAGYTSHGFYMLIIV